jgi:hypothetical protein
MTISFALPHTKRRKNKNVNLTRKKKNHQKKPMPNSNSPWTALKYPSGSPCTDCVNISLKLNVYQDHIYDLSLVRVCGYIDPADRYAERDHPSAGFCSSC